MATVVTGERSRQRGPQFGPAGLVVLRRQVGGIQTQSGQHGRVELWLDGADRDVAAVGAFVGVVVGRAAVEHVGATFVGPQAGGAHLPHHLDQNAGTVDHCGVHDLPPAGTLPFPERREYADQQEHRAAAEVTGQVQRRHRPLVGPADGVQDPVQRDVVDVVTRLLAARAGLSPAGHPGVDQPVVDLGAVLGAQTQPLGDAGPVALDQHVGFGDQLEDEFAPLVGLQIGGHNASVATHGIPDHAGRMSGRAIDAHHIRAQVTQDHRGMWARPDTGQFDDT